MKRTNIAFCSLCLLLNVIKVDDNKKFSFNMINILIYFRWGKKLTSEELDLQRIKMAISFIVKLETSNVPEAKFRFKRIVQCKF